ncbi:hypothetical protein EVAR_95791_1 [Eumeta japonica]|uniref:Uncharacterized protein n=1 Tax=Eumeta variegata TaxID=151549 RepID=A0A4C1W2Q7_EUMVA|nr:hypothetical protein EVAR_95791_1 [Eumeta japonica]
MTIKQVLEDIFNNVDQKAEFRNKAYGLVSTMNKLETGIMTITWNGILERLQVTSASLQSSDQDLNTGYALYESLYGYVQAMRSTFSDIEVRAKDLTNCEEYQQQSSRRIKRNTKYDHFSGSTTFDDGFVENQTHGQRFEVQVFIVIIDNVLSALTKRMKAHHNIASVFEVFQQLKLLRDFGKILQYGQCLRRRFGEQPSSSSSSSFKKAMSGSASGEIKFTLKLQLKMMARGSAAERGDKGRRRRPAGGAGASDGIIVAPNELSRYLSVSTDIIQLGA